MGYFPNGTAGTDYELRYCDRCVHRGPDEGPGCPVWGLHLEYNYDQNKDETLAAILSTLIPISKDGLWNDECRMFVEGGEATEYQPPLFPW